MSMVKDDRGENRSLQRLGVLYEAMQDDIKKVLEIVGSQQPSLMKIPKMSERVEKLESDMSTVKLATMGTNHDLKIIKIRTEKLEEISDQIKDHETRLTGLEQTV